MIFVAHMPDGEILGVAPSREWLAAAFPEAGIVDHPARFTPRYHCVEGGAVVPKTAAEIQSIDDASAWRGLRAERNRRLTATDWTQVPDAPVDQATWRAYRQALRDLPANTTDPRHPDWPARPE